MYENEAFRVYSRTFASLARSGEINAAALSHTKKCPRSGGVKWWSNASIFSHLRAVRIIEAVVERVFVAPREAR